WQLDPVVPGPPPGTVSVLLGDGRGDFGPPQPFAVEQTPDPNMPPQPVAIVAADFDGDGNLGPATGNRGDNTGRGLLGDGRGSLRPKAAIPVGGQLPQFVSRPGALVAADFDGDGHTDLAVANNGDSPGTVSVLRGKGDGTFAAPVSLVVGGGINDTVGSTP